MTGPADGDEASARFLRVLDDAASRSTQIAFWWRDDDAETATPALDRLLRLARRNKLPLALAIIPKGADAPLAARLADEPAVTVLQHGWQHMRHSPEGEKKMELGDHRPLAAVLDELSAGRERLQALFPRRFLPVLVPPWNRISATVREARGQAGLPGLSTYGPAPRDTPHWINTHVDLIDWTSRGPLSRSVAYALLCREVERRRSGDREPIGLLTHHLIHQERTWDFLEELLDILARHPAASWPRIADLFALSPSR